VSLVHVVRFGAGTARRYLAQADTPCGRVGDRRPLIWVRGFDRALKFASAPEARAFALNGLGHGLWEIGVAAPSDVPADELEGSLAAIRAAA
jgi:hypothetical protein